jgi:hypothetical protein
MQNTTSSFFVWIVVRAISLIVDVMNLKTLTHIILVAFSLELLLLF